MIGAGTVVVSTAKEVVTLVVSNGATLMFTNWTTTLTASNVTVLSNGVVTLPEPFKDGWMSNRVHFVCSNFLLAAGGTIDVSGRGFLYGNGPGGGNTDGKNRWPGAGGSYGGRGGHGGATGDGEFPPKSAYGYWADDPYGSPETPVQPGSGGDSYQTNNPAQLGGSGGGAVRIEALGSATIDGAIRADGANGLQYSAGGSGGSIYITCGSLSGSAEGLLSAHGGTAFTRTTSDWGGCGAGGGGRIAVDYGSLGASKAMSFTTAAGSVGWRSNDWEEAWWCAAGPGTLWLTDTELLSALPLGQRFQDVRLAFASVREWAVDSLVVSNGSLAFLDGGFRVQVTNDVRIDSGGVLRIGALDSTTNAPQLDVGGNLALTNGARLYVYASDTNDSTATYGARLRVTNNVTIGPTSWMHLFSHGVDGGSATMRMGNLDVAAGGGIDAWGKGYQSTKGPGGTKKYVWAGGGGHGGRGGDGWADNASAKECDGGGAYGSVTAPFEAGSGAGNYRDTAPTDYGGYGGGVVRVDASGGSVTIDGTITADGHSSGFATAGGAGGSVHITCDTLGGTGTISAEGGLSFEYTTPAQTYNAAGGGGGGGRIALDYGSLSPTHSLDVSADAGYGNYHPSPGDRRNAKAGTVSLPGTNLLPTALSALQGEPAISGFSSWSVPSLTVSNATLTLPEGFTLAVAGDLVVGPNAVLELQDGGELTCDGNLTVKNGGELRVNAAPTNGTTDYGALVRVDGTTTIESGGRIDAYCDWTNGAAPLFRLVDLTVQTGAVFTADGAGYRDSHGPGQGEDDTAGWTAGGGYGGRGGDGYGANTPVLGGGTYGSSNAPVSPGSGGGKYRSTSGQNGGNGGGVVRIYATGDVTVDGEVRADGEGAQYADGGGSGGSVFIVAGGDFSGVRDAVVSANGGDGATSSGTYYGGGGGGGRVAIWHGVSAGARDDILNGSFPAGRVVHGSGYPPFRGDVTVTAGRGWSNPSWTEATDGTVVFLTVTSSAGTMFMIR